MPFDRITLIYNPNSTGDAPKLAQELYEDIKKRLPDTPAELKETQRAGHAEELAKAAAASDAYPLIISVSGDGGYHEVVNGIIGSGNSKAVGAVKGAGNANDHRTATREQTLIEAIISEDVRHFDLLKVEISNKPARYAHSYVGLGISPVVAVELNRHTLNAIKEIQLVIKTFRAYRPFKIEVDGQVKTLDSLVFGNIPRMAKVLKLSEDTTPDDGRFELVIAKHTSKLMLLLTAIRLVTLGAPKPKKLKNYSFKTLKPMPMQMDGEVFELKPNTSITISSAKQALNTLV